MTLEDDPWGSHFRENDGHGFICFFIAPVLVLSPVFRGQSFFMVPRDQGFHDRNQASIMVASFGRILWPHQTGGRPVSGLNDPDGNTLGKVF